MLWAPVRHVVFLTSAAASCVINVTSDDGLEGIHVATTTGATCQAAWISHARGELVDAMAEAFDLVLTDDLRKVPFAGRRNQLVFLERLGRRPIPNGKAMDSILQMKDHLLSILLPPEGSAVWADPQTTVIANQAMQVMPQHVYVNEPAAEQTMEDAFKGYRFSLIVDDENSTISPALIHAVAWGTIPMFNGFSHLVAMLPRVVLPWNRSHFRIEQLLNFLPEINQEIGSLWQQHRMLQDQLLYRYGNSDFRATLKAYACSLCENLKEGEEKAVNTPLIFVGVYSAARNVEKRNVLRKTWSKVFQSSGFLMKFFLGTPQDELAKPVKSEIHRYQDIVPDGTKTSKVLLDVQEGYEWNSLKGLRFLEWCSSNVLAEFVVKVDDDVYLRPLPLISLLRHRPPVGYVWGYFDFFSPVPREEGQAFYNSEETYPFDAFPPYARGLLRALSLDVVQGLAALSREGRLPLISGDDPCFGVHLRYLRDDPFRMPSLTLDDRDSYRVFAMEPSCNPGLWSHVTHRSWVVHHVSPEQVQCMWDSDVATGLYSTSGEPSPKALEDAEKAGSFATQLDMREPPPFPELCHCLSSGPLAEELAARKDKINASRTFLMWGHPSLLDEDL